MADPGSARGDLHTQTDAEATRPNIRRSTIRAEETFRVIQQAMRARNKVALSRLVLASRERLVALAPRDKGLLVMTLRTAAEVRDGAPLFEDMLTYRDTLS